jgi:hypothetical protein
MHRSRGGEDHRSAHVGLANVVREAERVEILLDGAYASERFWVSSV